MKDYTTLKLGSFTHVLVSCERATKYYANFNQSGLALCGVLLPGEDLETWQERTTEQNIINDKINSKLVHRYAKRKSLIRSTAVYQKIKDAR